MINDVYRELPCVCAPQPETSTTCTTKVTALDFQPPIRLWGNHPFSFVSTRAKYLLKESPEYGGIYLCGNGGKATRSGE